MPYLHSILVSPNQLAIVINGNQNLEELWDWNQRDKQLDIQGGRLQFQDNPRLCNIHIKQLMEITGTKNLTKFEVSYFLSTLCFSMFIYSIRSTLNLLIYMKNVFLMNVNISFSNNVPFLT